jgi:hypothetical protein
MSTFQPPALVDFPDLADGFDLGLGFRLLDFGAETAKTFPRIVPPIPECRLGVVS